MEKKKRKNLSIFPLAYRGAVGETRTRTGLLPLPPQSSVSTISPPPLCFGIAKVRTIFKLPNLFAKNLNIFENIFLGPAIWSPEAAFRAYIWYIS